MAKKTKRDWLEAGVEILIDVGSVGLTVEALTKQLKVTKGSFYHHFRGIDDYIGRFLTYYEEEGTLQIIAIVDLEPDAAAKLKRLIQVSTSYPPQLGVAMRAWAWQDERVGAVKARIDQRRIAYVRDLWAEIVGDTPLAQQLATMSYALLVGGEHILPPVAHEQLYNLFKELFHHYNVHL